MPAATAACGSRPLLLFSLWGFEADLAAACTTAVRQGFDGLEVNLRHPALEGLAAVAVVEQLAAVLCHLCCVGPPPVLLATLKAEFPTHWEVL